MADPIIPYGDGDQNELVVELTMVDGTEATLVNPVGSLAAPGAVGSMAPASGFEGNCDVSGCDGMHMEPL